ncbi:aminotransferase class IV [Cloacibacillus evryensis]|uniref:aminotransferase class IV n=1 Tax=Cloacibacillus evryensis TaxID=508460 RepID=UPI003AB209C5
MTLCYMNGKYAPISECHLPVTDMAIQRGAAVFEAIRIYDGKLFGMEMHLERFARSAEGAGIAAGNILPRLPEIFKAGVKMEGCPAEGLVRPYITGGDINNKGSFPEPRFFVLFGGINKTPEEERRRGAVLEPNRMERPFPLCKSINYLLALIPLGGGDKVNHESLYMPAGEITEAMTNNFFLCKDGKIITAPAGRVLDGVTRSVVLALARENGFTIEERCPPRRRAAPGRRGLHHRHRQRDPFGGARRKHHDRFRPSRPCRGTPLQAIFIKYRPLAQLR